MGTGALTGTSTAWYGAPASSARALAWPVATAWVAKRKTSGSRVRASGSVVARRGKSVESRADSVAPMRAPWFASTETMVSASFERDCLAKAVVGGEQAGAARPASGRAVEQALQERGRRPRGRCGRTRWACSDRLARRAPKLASWTVSSRPRESGTSRAADRALQPTDAALHLRGPVVASETRVWISALPTASGVVTGALESARSECQTRSS